MPTAITYEDFEAAYLEDYYKLSWLKEWFKRAQELGRTETYSAKTLARICFEDHLEDLRKYWEDVEPIDEE